MIGGPGLLTPTPVLSIPTTKQQIEEQTEEKNEFSLQELEKGIFPGYRKMHHLVKT